MTLLIDQECILQNHLLIAHFIPFEVFTERQGKDGDISYIVFPPPAPLQYMFLGVQISSPSERGCSLSHCLAPVAHPCLSCSLAAALGDVQEQLLYECTGEQ